MVIARFGKNTIAAIASCILLVCWPVCADGLQRPKKKIVEYGWDVPYPDFVERNITEMEKRPFDGIIFRTKGFDHLFDIERWDANALQPQLDTLAAIKWHKFSDNFLTLYAANKGGMDWFNDDHWNTIIENMKLFSLAVQKGHCVGVCFDPEAYGTDPWVYPGSRKDKSFDEVADQVRKRGRQLIGALEANMPQLKLLSFFQLGMYGGVVDEPDPTVRREKLLKQWMALLPSFYVGILEGASPDTILIDGNESAYYYESRESFFQAYHLMRQRAMTLVPENLRRKYNAQVQAGMALYIDQTLAMRTTETISRFLSPQEQLDFFEHNVYYALTTSDEYVWCYSERMNWWLPSEKVQPDRTMPAGVEDALIRGREKYRQGKPLGYDIKDMIEKARDKRRAAKAKE
jgi:hypothetical protein